MLQYSCLSPSTLNDMGDVRTCCRAVVLCQVMMVMGQGMFNQRYCTRSNILSNCYLFRSTVEAFAALVLHVN